MFVMSKAKLALTVVPGLFSVGAAAVLLAGVEFFAKLLNVDLNRASSSFAFGLFFVFPVLVLCVVCFLLSASFYLHTLVWHKRKKAVLSKPFHLILLTYLPALFLIFGVLSLINNPDSNRFSVINKVYKDATIRKKLRPGGIGSTSGKVFWNGIPVQNAVVSLKKRGVILDKDGTVKKDTVSTTKTDAEGTYSFVNVPNDIYTLYIEPKYGFVRNVASSSVVVYPDTTTIQEPVHVYKRDLIPIAPIGGIEITEQHPTLTWQPYTQADFYEVALLFQHPDKKYKKLYWARVIEEFPQVTTNTYKVPVELGNCNYEWTIRAYTVNNTLLAEISTPDYPTFTVTGNTKQCLGSTPNTETSPPESLTKN